MVADGDFVRRSWSCPTWLLGRFLYRRCRTDWSPTMEAASSSGGPSPDWRPRASSPAHGLDSIHANQPQTYSLTPACPLIAAAAPRSEPSMYSDTDEVSHVNTSRVVAVFTVDAPT